MIKAEIVAHSLSPQGEELMSVLATFPRIILAEKNTHRMLSKNTSSSRAIPFNKMVEAIMENPFIPIAWQRNHPGMQGTEYLSKTDKYCIDIFMKAMYDTLEEMLDKNSKEYLKLKKEFDEKVELLKKIFSNQVLPKELIDEEKTLDEWWLFARDRAVEAASIMYIFDVTKQLDNRLLEPFMWTTMLITGSKEGWENFFRLRCPSYEIDIDGIPTNLKSKKDANEYLEEQIDVNDYLAWAKANKGQAEIHIMDLAEKIWDARNESTPKQLKPGEWHIPFEDKIDELGILPLIKTVNIHSEEHKKYIPLYAKISTAMAARTSYTVVGDEKVINYENMIALHDRLLNQEPPHSSPFEHTARAMTTDEYMMNIKGKCSWNSITEEIIAPVTAEGWCYNLKGFIPYRYLVDNNLEL